MSVELTSSVQPQPPVEANLGYLFRLVHQRFRSHLDEELEGIGLSAQENGILSVFETRARAAFDGLSEQDEATVRPWLSGLAARTTRLGHADTDRKEKQ